MDFAEKDVSRLEETRREYRNFARRKLEWTEYARGILGRTEAEVKALRAEWKKTRAPESPRLRELKEEFYSIKPEKGNTKRLRRLSKEREKEERERKKVAGRFYDTFFGAPDETLYKSDLYDVYNRALEELTAYFVTRSSGGFAGRVEWTRGGAPAGWKPWKSIGVKRADSKWLEFPPMAELAEAKYGDFVEISATETGYRGAMKR